MIRNVTILLAGVALVMAFALYHLKYRAEAAGRTIASLERSIEREREHVKLLRADWSNLTSPGRLDVMARRHLGFKPTMSRQIITLERLASLAPEREPDPGLYDAAAFEQLLRRLPGEADREAPDSDALTSLLIQLRKDAAKSGERDAR